LSRINGDENSTNSDERSLRLRFSDNDSDKNNIDSQKVQQASIHLDTNKQPSDLQGDSGTMAAELPPPRDNNSGEDNSSSSDDEESLSLSSVIDLISVQQKEIGDVAMEVEHESVQQNQVPTEHHPICAWGMDARTTSYFGNRYGEYCCLGTKTGQTPCNHNVCNAIVHPICHINWLSRMDLNLHNDNPVTCPRHSVQYHDYVRMREHRNSGAVRGNDGLSVERATQRPKRHNFERNSYKMALKIAPAKKFLLNVQPELRQATGEKSCTNSTICT
jgi:hypothetical protein